MVVLVVVVVVENFLGEVVDSNLDVNLHEALHLEVVRIRGCRKL